MILPNKHINDVDEKIYVLGHATVHSSQIPRKIVAAVILVGGDVKSSPLGRLYLLFSWPRTGVAISWAWQCGPVTVRLVTANLGGV